MCLFQLNNLWFVKYLPSQKEKLKRFAEYCKRLNNFVRKKVKQRKLKMEDGKQCKDFITSYLKEVQNSNGALEDRYGVLRVDLCVTFRNIDPRPQSNIFSNF